MQPRKMARLWVYEYRIRGEDLPIFRRAQKGLVVATSQAAAHALLPGQQGGAVRLRRSIRPLVWQLSTVDILLFTQQLSALLKASLPLLQILNLLSASHPNKVMRQLLRQLQYEVTQGRSLAQAFGLYESVFGSLYVSTVAAGELSGRLEDTVQSLVQSLSKQQHLKRQLRMALAYPALILVLSVVLVLGLVGFVLPSFVVMYDSMGVELPMMTLWLLGLTDWVMQHLGWLGGVLLGVGLLSRYLWQQAWFGLWVSRQTLRLPVVGTLYQQVILARWANTFALLHHAGLPLLSLLVSVAQVSQHRVYELATQAIQQHVAEGQSLSVAMRATECFPELLLQLVLAGEEAGALDELLYQAAAYYTDEVDQKMALLSVWLEPLLLLFLGGVVGAVLLALYLPLFNIGDVIG